MHADRSTSILLAIFSVLCFCLYANGRPAANINNGLNRACDSIQSIMDSCPKFKMVSQKIDTVDDIACLKNADILKEINYSGVLRQRIGGLLVHEYLIKYLQDNAWSSIDACSADGPDGTLQGFQQKAEIIIIRAEWDGGDDSDTTYIPSDSCNVIIYCARIRTRQEK